MTGIIPLTEAASGTWDVVVIGAGMGGAAVTSELARNGLRVLVLEQGRARFSESADINKGETDPGRRLDMGRFPRPLTGEVEMERREFYAPLGAGVGGSSLLYAAALDRFEPRDFETPSAGPSAMANSNLGISALKPRFRSPARRARSHRRCATRLTRLRR